MSDWRIRQRKVREFSPGDRDKLLPDRLKAVCASLPRRRHRVRVCRHSRSPIADVHCSRYAVRCEPPAKISQRPSQFLTWSVGFGMH
jgi:hypothetical protein